MKKVYLLIIFTLLISSNILSCKNVKNENITIGSENENVAVEVESENKDTLQASYNSTEVANIIFKIPEIVALNTSIRNATDGKRGATILYTEDESQDFFELKVGDSNEFRFQTYYRFLIDHSTSDIYAIWDDEQLFPLDEWNKINNIAKEYSNKEDSLKYINYISEHYKNIPTEINGYLLTQSNDKGANIFDFLYSKIEILNTNLPFISEWNIPLDERTLKWENLFSQLEINLENFSQNEKLISFTCGDKTFNYYPLVQIKDIKVVLSPSQCGDFYHVFLLVFNKEELKSSIYVDGLYSDDINEHMPILENTYFSIGEKNNISIYKRVNDEITINNYHIQDDGRINPL